MIPKRAIELAIEGEWKDKELSEAYQSLVEDYWEEIALDPTFWRSLGKSLGWDDSSGGKYAHEFYDLILREQPTEAFWDTIYPSKEE